MCSRISPLWILSAAFLILTVCPSASAAGPPAKPAPSQKDLAAAKKHFSTAKAFYSAGDYRTAKTEFEEAYKLTKLPDLLFNLARTEEKMDHYKEAIAYLERYLSERPSAQDATSIRSQIEVLRLKLPRPEPKKPVAPPPPPVIAAPQASDSDRPPMVAGDLQKTAQVKESSSRVPPWPAITLLTGGAAMVIAGVGLGGGAIVAANEVADPMNSGRYFDDALQETERRGKALEASAIGMFISGAIAFTAGAAWTGYFVHQRNKKKEVRATLIPYGPGALLSGSF